jgi:hypothetical protein
MSLSLRILLLVGALLAFWFVIVRVRRNKILMQDAIYWVLLSVLILVAAIFPQIFIWLSRALGFISPSNFVFLVIVALLLVKIFSNSIEISMLRHKVEELAQEAALRDAAGDHASARGDVSEKGTRSQP